MKKALIFSGLTLLVLLGLCLADDAVLSRRCDGWMRQLTAAETAVEAEDWPGARDAMDALQQSWDGWQEYLHIIIDHEAISEAEQLLETCRQALETQEAEMFWEHSAPLRCQLELLAELEQLSLKNLL